MKRRKRRKREIRVFAPLRPTIRPEDAELKAHKIELEKERLKVLEFSQKIGAKFSAILIAVGTAFLCFSAYLTITGTVVTVGALENKMLFAGVLIFMGIVNIIGGLLLMGSRH